MTDDKGNIIKFRGEHNWLSNFYDCKPIRLLDDENLYPSVEHAYQAAKTDNMEYRKQIAEGDATHSKRFFKTRKNSVRSEWEEVKLDMMYALLLQKFSFIYHPVLAQKLVDTGDVEIIEGNSWWDRYWGQCPIGVGENHLGKLLMKIRSQLKARNEHVQH